MTDLIDRVDRVDRVDPALSEQPVPPDSELSTSSGQPRGSAQPIRRSVPILLAVTLGSSSVLLFAMASGHLRGAEATVATAAALVQVIAAVMVLAKPSRALFVAVASCNVAIAGVWVVTMDTQTVSMVTSAIGLALSAAGVLVAAALAVRSDMGHDWDSSTAVFGSVLPVGIVILTIVGLFTTATTGSAPAQTSPSSASRSANSATARSPWPPRSRCPARISKTFQSVIAGNNTEQSELKKWVPLSAPDQAILTQQLTEAYQAAERFPTVASAKAAGMILAGGMAPGVGAHYQAIGDTAFSGYTTDNAPFDPSKPASWIYASTADNAPVVGIMYESLDQTSPAGFIGPNDHWHQHSNVCVQFSGGQIGVPFAADQNVTPQECSDVHGTFMKKTVWMVHSWVVPGWESPQGVFSHDNLHVYCPGNTDITNAIGFCLRQS